MSEDRESYEGDWATAHPHEVEPRRAGVDHYHHTVPNKGTVTVKVERNSRGTNYEVRIERPVSERIDSTAAEVLTEIAVIQQMIDDPESDYNRTLRGPAHNEIEEE